MAKVGTKREFKENVNYRWEPSDEFVLSGVEFSRLLNYFINEVHGTKGTPIEQVGIHSFLQEKLKLAVENGVAVEEEPTAYMKPQVLPSQELGL